MMPAKQTNTVCCKFCGVLTRMNRMNKGYYACADPEGGGDRKSQVIYGFL